MDCTANEVLTFDAEFGSAECDAATLGTFEVNP
jgi:hypothetical protein